MAEATLTDNVDDNSSDDRARAISVLAFSDTAENSTAGG